METIDTINYRGFNINIHYDMSAENPWEDCDGMPSIAIYSDCIFNEYGGEEIFTPPTLTRQEIKDNLSEIKDILGVKTLVELHHKYHWLSDFDAVNLVNESLSDELSNTSSGDLLGVLATLYKAKGTQCLSTSVTGHVQGEYADVLVVATDTFYEVTGCDKDTDLNLKSFATLYENWAFGNVYGYTIDEINESCWGFYGYDHKKSGLMEYAKNAIDCHIQYERKQHYLRLKEMIKNHVPLGYRKPLDGALR